MSTALKGTNDKRAGELLAEGVRGAEQSIAEYLQRALDSTAGQIEIFKTRRSQPEDRPTGDGGRKRGRGRR